MSRTLVGPGQPPELYAGGAGFPAGHQGQPGPGCVLLFSVPRLLRAVPEHWAGRGGPAGGGCGRGHAGHAALHGLPLGLSPCAAGAVHDPGAQLSTQIPAVLCSRTGSLQNTLHPVWSPGRYCSLISLGLRHIAAGAVHDPGERLSIMIPIVLGNRVSSL